MNKLEKILLAFVFLWGIVVVFFPDLLGFILFLALSAGLGFFLKKELKNAKKRARIFLYFIVALIASTIATGVSGFLFRHFCFAEKHEALIFQAMKFQLFAVFILLVAYFILSFKNFAK